MGSPLVSVICLCYNHASFIKEALDSVLHQTYEQIEIIVVDDCSIDASAALIESFVSANPRVVFIKNEVNIGNCKSFNKALKISKGKYVIDFATDDIMLPSRIKNQVNAFESLASEYGVIYSDVIEIDETGIELKRKNLSNNFPSGNLYTLLLKKYFISPPSMMIKREVLDYLGGYDESLAYEDFDFWVRSSRVYKYHYQNEILTKRRIVKNSHSTSFLRKRGSLMSESTFRVVLKAMWLNRTNEEENALVQRINFELRHAFYMQNYKLVKKYYVLLEQLKEVNYWAKIFKLASQLKIPVYKFYSLYKGN